MMIFNICQIVVWVCLLLNWSGSQKEGSKRPGTFADQGRDHGAIYKFQYEYEPILSSLLLKITEMKSVEVNFSLMEKHTIFQRRGKKSFESQHSFVIL
jgi:hypothetical protein